MSSHVGSEGSRRRAAPAEEDMVEEPAPKDLDGGSGPPTAKVVAAGRPWRCGGGCGHVA